jgi:hypothetical protein
MKTAELTGAQLDYWVAKIEGFTLESVRDVGLRTGVGGCGAWVMFGADGFREGYIAEQGHEDELCGDGGPLFWSPSTNWEHGGPIIGRERISVDAEEGGPRWTATKDDPASGCAYWWPGPTPLIAAMRAYVHSVFGEKVPDA